ncbi:PREDICTED: uncharacterized protein LOC105561648 isoform X3 [Vollenhovia emeryi]|uniref:uncharacterized protein LOC105561648 isoform X3 n=1 Tax=Vollenhovia emeryi TaxID=411798 RepID=UPI0005F461D6|nr:PREDICTED: uncharacterized protein LOC105561648 isoform X3 [Vollenhovia emeryi]
MQDTTKLMMSSRENQSSEDIDKYARDATERYELAEARSAVKYMECFVKNMKHIVDQNSAKPGDYDKWTDKEKYEHVIDNLNTYAPSVPDSLLFLISGSLHRGDCNRNSTDKPLWLDMEKFQRGQKFAQDYMFSIFFANVLSLFLIYAYPDSIKPLILSQKSHTPYLAFKRYLSTACRIKNWMTENMWSVDTRAYKDIQTVRRMHRAIRLKLCESDNGEIDEASKIQKPWCPNIETILKDFSSCPNIKNICVDIPNVSKGLNQSDMAATQFSFVRILLLYPHELGIHANEEDLEAFCHVWRSIGYLLGIEDHLQEVKERSHEFIEFGLKPYLRQATPEWEHMMRCITEFYNSNSSAFQMLLLLVTDLLNIDMPRLRKTLSYSERFYLILQRFIFRYAMKLRFVREYMNKLAYKSLEKGVKCRPETHEKLKKKSEEALNKGRQQLYEDSN